MSVKKRIIGNSLTSKVNKPNTVTRAAITANIKFTRGKQLVEHAPFSLIPDPQNPRPGELIDDVWLIENLKIGSEETFCKIDPKSGEYEIPEFSDLLLEYNEKLEESYNFLKGLAYSIRNEGLIEPIEIFLADKNNDPDYFVNTDLEFGYVVLEGHQRRLAAMMAGVPTVTCIEITDETMLSKLKVKHRKLRRQLSENNLRKGLTVSQNFQIVHSLLSENDGKKITARELSSIIGLNEAIAGTLKTISTNIDSYPPDFISMIKENKFTFKNLRSLVSKSYEEIERALTLEPKENISIKDKTKKARGRQGGAVKKSATFKIKDENESCLFQKFLLSRFPELEVEKEEEFTFKTLESILKKIKDMALVEEKA